MLVVCRRTCLSVARVARVAFDARGENVLSHYLQQKMTPQFSPKNFEREHSEHRLRSGDDHRS
jgi:hypothetical protein